MLTTRIENKVKIQSGPSSVWKALTEPELMKKWMGEPEMKIEIKCNWKMNHPIVISGFHHAKFENKGIILQFEPHKTLKYSHLSSLSKLPDEPDSYSIIEFNLIPSENQTLLIVTISNFPTESIFKHLEFYWKTTIEILKNFIETEMSHPLLADSN